MSWKRIATLALGVGSVVAGTLIPAAAVYLVPVGVGLLGLGTNAEKQLGPKPKE